MAGATADVTPTIVRDAQEQGAGSNFRRHAHSPRATPSQTATVPACSILVGVPALPARVERVGVFHGAPLVIEAQALEGERQASGLNLQ